MEAQAPFRFATLSHSSALCDTIRKHLSLEDDFTVHYQLVPMGRETEAAMRLLETGTEAIFCIGGTAHTLKHTIGADSLAIVERPDMDVVERLLEARQYTREVALSTEYRQAHNIALMEQLLDMRIHHVRYANLEDLKYNVERAIAQGISTFVGGGLFCNWARECGKTSILLEPTKASVVDALHHARSIARRKRQEDRRQAEFLGILERLDEGVICVDCEGVVFFANPSARDMLPVHLLCDINRENAHLGPLKIETVLRDGVARVERVVAINRTQFMTSVMPLPVNGGMRGAVVMIRDVASVQNMDRKIRSALYSRGFVSRFDTEALKGGSLAMSKVKDKIRRYAATQAAVHIHGETGTGKELAAHAVHAESVRRKQPFVIVNCSALPESLLESELFGHEEGAFTGAKRGGKAGLFEMANKGTLFLDEIGEINHAVQLRLLRVLEAREVMRLGGARVVPIDVRIISASHKPLMELVRNGHFRADLYYRLMVLQLAMPPLRSHTPDIPELLAPLFLRYGKTRDSITPAMLAMMREYTWPGNVRELFTVVENYFVLLGEESANDDLFREILLERSSQGLPSGREDNCCRVGDTAGTLKDQLARAKVRLARDALSANGNDRSRTARQLGVSYNTLWRLLRDE